MKVLLILPSLNHGGVETGTVDLSSWLRKYGAEVIVVSSGGTLVKKIAELQVRHITLPVHKKSIFVLLQVKQLIKIIKKENIDIVHAQSRIPAWVAYLACLRARVPFITSCHGYYSRHFFSMVMGWGIRVVVISRIIGRLMVNAFGVPKENIRLVYRGVDLSQYIYNRDKYKDRKGRRFIITNIGRLTPIKGQLEFIEAINIVRKEMPGVEAWIVGEAGKKHLKYKNKLYNLVKELKLENTVKFLGGRSDIGNILRESDLLVLSTTVPEAFGRVVIEAGASGTAVCAPDAGALPEIIDDGINGVLYSVGQKDSMAKKIAEILKSPNLMQDYSRNLRKKVELRFSLERMAKETLKVYQEVIEEKKILVIKLGGLGDVILAIPSLRALRRAFPMATISLLVEERFETLVKQCPYINEVIICDRQSVGFFDLVNKLKERRFNISIDFKNNAFTHLLSFFSGIPERYGFRRGLFSRLINRAEDFSCAAYDRPVQQQFNILNKLGVSTFDDGLELWVKKEDSMAIENLLVKEGISKEDKIVGLAIGASHKWPTKSWPIDNFVELSNRLSSQGVKIVLLGDENSRNKVKPFLEGSKNSIFVDFVGRTNLDQLVALIDRLDLLICPDSAPLHIASAVKTGVIVMFGPTEPSRHLPPATDIMDVIFKQVPCQPCYKRSCTNRGESLLCLKNISVEEVFDLAVKRLSSQQY